jgi:hypothetical protein
MSSRSFRVNIFQVKEMMRLRDKYKKKGKLVNLLVKKQEFDKDLDKVLVNQMRNVMITETEIYKSKMNINKCERTHWPPSTRPPIPIPSFSHCAQQSKQWPI